MNALEKHMAMMRDAGLLRRYVVERFGTTLLHGGDVGRYYYGKRLVARLAKLVGRPVADVLADVLADVE